ncbi:glycosyltransferase family 2 protein [Acetobacter sp.]|jgi:GT2 family glycosyltransferase|uniref:glycosyltransferase family 2 protein n=1 Tax=Acetobacter sp. TaxID=440 RepID=UPI0025BEC4F8|nr:glycosyltransferase [Acetobacter sp.]MCH4091299.1 glycosyltransferase [Acetobacter sp.]MCI1299277.1 glycosyltransferase [Acetobacter sp.]MCI1316719.1 glycosyltransferase [Acetobacter sp.]
MKAPLPTSRQITQFIGYFDSLDGLEVKGWACNLAAPRVPATLHVIVDGQEIGSVTCDLPRTDVQENIGVMTPNLGFSFRLPDALADGKEHRVGLRFPNRSIVPCLVTDDGSIKQEDITVTFQPQFNYESCVDGFSRGALRGWVQRINAADGSRTGQCEVAVFIDGAPFARIRADRFRGDVAAAVGGDANCGFELVIPKHRRQTGTRTIRFFAVPGDMELMGSPISTSLVDNKLEEHLLGVSETIARLHREISSLRATINNLLPEQRFNLGDYDNWARRYFNVLRARVAERRQQLGADFVAKGPLVSVICPTYKPDMTDFIAAVESVMAQTWSNWELIIVDDGGKSLEVAARMAEYCRNDPRIKLIRLKKNLGISGATNEGVKAAKGEWVAFFDHDDAMVDVALEAMLQAAAGLDPQVIYSDEDKVDQAGYFLEPNFKPDFDYRYLLGCNYICHLTMVRNEVLQQVGDLNASYDGAQDHDLMLRLTEIVPREGFLHVPEVLYHWRKTPNSTAMTISNKQYAVNAGVRAVADHLRRVGHVAQVEAINDLTIYNVWWGINREPTVSIIIPFRNQADLTRECVSRILEHTDYKAYDIILVDNWSTDEDALAFCKEMSRNKRIQVLSIREEFNFSRLNNLAVASSSSEFFFFMNNDLFVDDPKWLKTIVGEAMAGEDIGAVGGKFVYPNGAIQHVGVVVGPDGVATHVHRGLQAHEYGYISRAILSHEVTAVTAAGMLVRAEAFREVGGFDEVNLKVAYNDVDLCLKMREAGWRIVQCNNFLAVHHESVSRGSDDRPEHEARFFAETQHMHHYWGDHAIYQHDPAYSPHFMLDQSYYDLVTPE